MEFPDHFILWNHCYFGKVFVQIKRTFNWIRHWMMKMGKIRLLFIEHCYILCNNETISHSAHKYNACNESQVEKSELYHFRENLYSDWQYNWRGEFQCIRKSTIHVYKHSTLKGQSFAEREREIAYMYWHEQSHTQSFYCII